MAITKENVIERIEVVTEYKHIQLATDLVIKEDGTEISRSRNRKVLTSDMDISGEDAQVKSIADVVWTQEIKDSWASYKASQEK